MSALVNSNARTIVVMHGDQTGEELLKQALRVLVPDVIGIELDFQHFDISLAQRRATQNKVVKDAADAMCATGQEGCRLP
jgi:isocitrate dehydrogenase (NAD+)